MKALITGGAGFIGSHLAEHLLAAGQEVVAIDDLSTGSLENIRPLHRSLTEALAQIERPWEIVFVDDGSTDGSGRQLEALVGLDPHVRVVQLRRNYGQTAAIRAGIRESSGANSRSRPRTQS